MYQLFVRTQKITAGAKTGGVIKYRRTGKCHPTNIKSKLSLPPNLKLNDDI